MNKITTAEFINLSKSQKIFLLDVRSPDEFQSCHFPGALNVPLDQIETGAHQEIPRNQPVYIMCQSGLRSERAVRILSSQNYSNLVCIQGGISECSKVPNLLNVRRHTLPLMRQVQIVAGSLVVLGIFLSQWVHPAFLALSFFVGAGLTFAGVSGFCGMALLLEKMPWNRFYEKKETVCPRA